MNNHEEKKTQTEQEEPTILEMINDYYSRN